jgi:hypothetical protein
MGTMSWSDDTRCLFCDGKLPLFRKRAQGQFCSKPHQEAYWKEQDQLAVEVLHRTHDAMQAYKPAVSIESILGPSTPPAAVQQAEPELVRELIPEMQGLTPQPGLGSAIAPGIPLIAAFDPVEYELHPNAATPRRELERAGGLEFGQLAGLLRLAKLTSIAPGLVAVPSTGSLLEGALSLSSPEFPCAKPTPRLGLGGLFALAGISPIDRAGGQDPAQALDFATSAVRDLTLSLAPRGDVLEQMEQQAFPFTDSMLALAAPQATFGRIAHRGSEFAGFRTPAPQAPEAPSVEAQPLALAASAGMFALAGAIAPRDWRAPMAAAVYNIEPRLATPEIDLPVPRAAVHDPLVDLLSAVGCAPQRRLTAPDLRVYDASPASRPVVYQALPATGATHIPAYTASSHDFAIRTQPEHLFSLRALCDQLHPRHELRLRAGFPAEPSSGEALLPKHKLQLRKWKQAPRVEAALLAEDQPVRRLTTGVAEFWNHAPRDLKMLLFAVPLALGLAFHPSLPKVSVQSPGSDTKAITAQFSEVLSTQMASLRKTMADRAAVGLDENFRQGLDNWMGNSGSTAEWSFDQAGFVQPGRVALYQPSLGLTDYEFQFLGAIDKGALSWVSRAVDFQNYYVVKLVMLKGGPVPAMGITRYAVINGQPVDRVDTPVTFQTRTDSLYRVSQVMDGDHFSLVIQGQMIDSWSDPRLKRGGIGFFTNRGEQSRIGWVQITHQYDTLGRLFAYLAP